MDNKNHVSMESKDQMHLESILKSLEVCISKSEVNIKQLNEVATALRDYLIVGSDTSIIPKNEIIDSYQFASFIPDGGNEVPFSHAINLISKSLDQLINPLVLIGKVGMGKTHLLFAIGNSFKEKYPEDQIQYFSAENFCNYLVNAVKEDRVGQIIDHLVDQDLLLLDDVHSLQDKVKTQEILGQVLESRIKSKRQTVITSVITPKKLVGFNDRLISLLSRSVLSKLKMPNKKTQIEILKLKARQLKIDIPETLISQVISKNCVSIRELEGRMISLIARSMKNPIYKGKKNGKAL